MAVLKVNGADMPAPSAMKISIFDVSATADRSASGKMIIDRVGTKRKLELSWAYLSAAELSALLTAVGEKTFFTAAYPDPQTGGERSMTCYCGDRATGVLRMENGAPVWTDVEMNWIER